MIQKSRIIVQNGVFLHINTSFRQEIREYLTSGEYESIEAQFVREMLSVDDIVLEIGTGIGFISTLCALQIGSERVFTFEANPELEPTIRQIYRLNRVSPELNMCLLSESPEPQAFYITESFLESNTVISQAACETVYLPTRSIRNELSRIRPTFIIADIQGGEFAFFRDADRSGVTKIVLELHEHLIGRAGVREIIELIEVSYMKLKSEGEVLILQQRKESDASCFSV